MPILNFPVGEFTPDSPDLAIPGSKIDYGYSSGLYDPYGNGISPMRDSRVVMSQVASGGIYTSGIFYNNVNGVGPFLFVTRNDAKIFKSTLTGAAPTDVTGTASTTGLGSNWLQWGGDIIQVDGHNLPSYSAGGTANFAPLITSVKKPKGTYIGAMSNYVIMARDAINNKGDYVFWSAINDSTNWDTSLATGAGEQKLVDLPGDVTGIYAGEVGLVFKQRGIFLMTYSGAPYTFDFSVLSGVYGTAYGGSIVGKGRNIYFMAADGFKRVARGYTTTIDSIGNGKVEGFLRSVQSNYFAQGGGVEGVFDYNSGLISWLFYASNLNEYDVVSYREETDQWFFYRPTYTPYNVVSGPFVDSFGLTSPSADVNASFFFLGNSLANNVQGGGGNPQAWTQTSLSCTPYSIKFKKIMVDPERRLFIRGVRLVCTATDTSISGPTLSCSIDYSNDPYFISGVTTVAAVLGPNGWYTTAFEAQYFRVSFTGASTAMTSTLREINFLQVDVSDDGGSVGV